VLKLKCSISVLVEASEFSQILVAIRHLLLDHTSHKIEHLRRRRRR
jgi:hypothetical protein